MPGLSVIRPGDSNETVAAWKVALESKDKPTALVLTRQNLKTLESTQELAYEGVKKGAYIASKSSGETNALLLATGSEVPLAVEAQDLLEKEGIHVDVISMPSWDRFEAQTQAYKDEVISPNVKVRLGIGNGIISRLGEICW